MGCFKRREDRLMMMIGLTAAYFLVELVVGNVTNCLALTADAFHVMSDCLALIITLVAVKVKDRGEDHKYTFGWRRAELVGGLVNSVFLLALLFTVCVDSIKRLFYPEDVTQPVVLMVTASLGLLINIFGLVVFREHGHIGGCSHSHGGESHGHAHSHSHGHSHACGSGDSGSASGSATPSPPSSPTNRESTDTEGQSDGEKDAVVQNGYELVGTAANSKRKRHAKKEPSEGAINHKALYLHMMGDAMASVGVILGVLVMWQATGWEARHIVDPILSLAISALLLKAVLPLISKTVRIMLQGTPDHVDIHALRHALQAIPDVLEVHKLNVWQLTDTQNVGTCQLVISPEGDVFEALAAADDAFRANSVQRSTIQPAAGKPHHAESHCHGHSHSHSNPHPIPTLQAKSPLDPPLTVVIA